MYAKSMIDLFRERYPNGSWMYKLNLLPVALALGVAVLPFTLSFAPMLPAGSADDAAASNQPELVSTAVAGAHKRSAIPEDRRQRAMAEFMSRKYRVSFDVVQDLVKTAHVVGKQFGVDPALLVAMISVESGFNPISESVAGAKGLMQIIPKYHLEKLAKVGGEQAIFDPRANIAVGAMILKEYLISNSGDLFAALQTYAGGLADREAIYSHRVLNEKDRLDELAGTPKTARNRVAPLTPADTDRVQISIPPAPAGSTVPVAVPPAQPALQPPVKGADEVRAPQLPAAAPMNVSLRSE